MPEFGLDKAYSIDGADQARSFYDDWATRYDSSFGAKHGYVSPREVARIFNALDNGNAPILDIGAGTGLVAEHLKGKQIDAIDISEGMLKQAETKGLYRNHIVADLTKPLPMPDEYYGGFVSCGTFTHGHVGPEVLPELMRVAKPGALFACSVIAKVYDVEGFGSALAEMVAHKLITPVDFHDIPIYENADHDHANDRGLVMVFRRTI